MHGLNGPVGILLHGLLAEADAAAQIVIQAGDHRVLLDVTDAENTCGTALLRQQGEAVLDGLPGGLVLDLLAVEADGAASLGHGAEQVLQHLGAAGAVQSGDAQHLALAKLEAGLLQTGILTGQVFYLQDHVAGYIVLGREAVGQLTAHHQLNDLAHGQVLGVAGGHPLTVAHDGDLVADAEDLIHLVTDIDNAAAALAQHIDDAEQVLHLGLRQRGGRLVEHDDLGVVADGLGDLHHLPLGNGQRGHDGLGIHVNVQLLKDLPRALTHGGLADHDAARLGVAAQPQVVHHAAGQCLIQLLMDHGDAVFQRLLRIFEINFLAVQNDGAAVFGIDAKQALHQRGFSRAVLAHQRMDGTGPDGKGNAVQRLDTREFLCDIPHFQQCRLLHMRFPPVCIISAALRSAAQSAPLRVKSGSVNEPPVM